MYSIILVNSIRFLSDCFIHCIRIYSQASQTTILTHLDKIYIAYGSSDHSVLLSSFPSDSMSIQILMLDTWFRFPNFLLWLIIKPASFLFNILFISYSSTYLLNVDMDDTSTVLSLPQWLTLDTICSISRTANRHIILSNMTHQ